MEDEEEEDAAEEDEAEEDEAEEDAVRRGLASSTTPSGHPNATITKAHGRFRARDAATAKRVFASVFPSASTTTTIFGGNTDVACQRSDDPWMGKQRTGSTTPVSP